nr:hypothetical protein [Candidatus Sigynarchaeota archaeon]
MESTQLDARELLNLLNGKEKKRPDSSQPRSMCSQYRQQFPCHVDIPDR